MPRQPPSPPVTARIRALLGVDGAGRRSPRAARARVIPADGQPVWGWIPDPPEQVVGTADHESGREARVVVAAGRGGRHRPAAGPGLVTTPLALRGARIHVSWQAVVAFVVVLLFAAVVFAVRVARADQTSTSRPVGSAAPAGVVGRSLPSAFATTGGTGPAAPPPSESVAAGGGGSGAGSKAGLATIVVHIVGQVARPGVVTVVSGARVVDAITLAGGPLPGADVQQVNLARTLVDGEQVSVPKPGETIPAAGAAGAAGGVADGGARVGAAAGVAGALIDLNGADVATLDGLPGVGPVLAQRIVDWRTEHKRFTTVDELGEVSGIGDKLLSQIRPKVRV